MKHPSIKLVLAICVIAFGSCSEVEIQPVVKGSGEIEERSDDLSYVRKLKTLPSSFVINGRTYSIRYNDQGLISTITASEGTAVMYQYVAHYDGEQLISADLVENGEVMSSNTNFQFDENGNIVAYDYVSYFFPEYPEGIVQHYTLEYTEAGQLSSLPGVGQLVYDKKGNVIQAGATGYRYESALNPLGAFPDLWLILVEESGYALLTLSPNVSTAQTTSAGTIRYINEYGKGRTLVSKSYVTNGQVIEVISYQY